MGKMINKYVMLLAALPVWLTFCTAPMDIDIRQGDTRLVIYSTLMDVVDSQRVYVQRTIPFFSTDLDSWVGDADVSISTSEGDTYTAHWDYRRRFYITYEKFATKPGVTYDLDVYYDFDGDGAAEHYTASTSVLEPLYLDSIKVLPMNLMGRKIYRLAIFGQDPPGPNYYIFRVGVNGELPRPQLKDWMATDDRLFDGSSFNNFSLGIYSSDPNKDTTNIYFAPGDSISLYLSHVDQDFLHFVYESQSSGSNSNPFFGTPPFNMRTNISGSAIGYFGNLYSTEVHTRVPGEPVSPEEPE